MNRTLLPPFALSIAALTSTALFGCADTAARIVERETRLYGESDRWSDESARRRRRTLEAPSSGGTPRDGELESYLRFGLENHAGLRAAFDRWIAALERVPQVTSLPDPRLSFSHFIERVETRTGPQRSRLRLAQTFPWFGKLELRGEVADRHAESMWSRVEATRLAVRRDIVVAFYEYGYLAHAIRIADENLELLRQLEPVVQRKVQTGGDQADLVRLQVEIGKLENDLDSLRARSPALAARLDAVLNRTGDGPLPIPEVEGADVVSLAFSDLQRRMLEANPELHALRQAVLREGKRVELARLEGFPDITIGFDFLETGSAVIDNQRGDGDDPFGIGISLNLPIWRQRYTAAEREARSARHAAEGDVTQRENALHAALALALFEEDDSSRQISLYRDTLLPRARQALDVTQSSYEAGSATLTDFIDSQRQLLSFERSYWRAVTRYEQRIADIEALVGGPVR